MIVTILLHAKEGANESWERGQGPRQELRSILSLSNSTKNHSLSDGKMYRKHRVVVRRRVNMCKKNLSDSGQGLLRSQGRRASPAPALVEQSGELVGENRKNTMPKQLKKRRGRSQRGGGGTR